jgi:hypothetical protein
MAAPAAPTIDAAFCLSDAVYERYNNTKECVYEACTQGDTEACELAESYNGNLMEDEISQEPPPATGARQP